MVDSSLLSKFTRNTWMIKLIYFIYDFGGFDELSPKKLN